MAAVVVVVTNDAHHAVHLQPAWRDRANFVIGASIPDSAGHHIQMEQLWARQISSDTFEICCIPFHLYDLALGDTVRTNGSFALSEVLHRAGHATYRVWFGEQLAKPADVEATVKDLGASLEWSGKDLLAIDAPDPETSQSIADYLYAEQQAGRLVYETGDRRPR